MTIASTKQQSNLNPQLVISFYYLLLLFLTSLSFFSLYIFLTDILILL